MVYFTWGDGSFSHNVTERDQVHANEEHQVESMVGF